MTRGKQTCKILKEIRRQIAQANDIDLVISECHFRGECRGTCPRCEAEVRYLEQQLEHRRMAGKAASVIGVSMSITSLLGAGGMASCQQNPASNSAEQFVSVKTDATPGLVLCDPIAAEIPEAADSANSSSIEKTAAKSNNPGKTQEIQTIELEGDVTLGIVDPADSFQGADSEFGDTYMFVDEMPKYTDGTEIYDYIRSQTRQPEAAYEKATGRVVVSFIVKADGTTDDLQILQGVDPILDEEALRIIKSVSHWTPGRLRGKEVNVRITVPLDFTHP